jgi:hypothetical protein
MLKQIINYFWKLKFLPPKINILKFGFKKKLNTFSFKKKIPDFYVWFWACNKNFSRIIKCLFFYILLIAKFS